LAESDRATPWSTIRNLPQSRILNRPEISVNRCNRISGHYGDHNPNAFTTWFAGGGFKGGTLYGASDEFGYKSVEKRVNAHDIHATVLHLMVLDHEKLTYRFNGRDFRLTDVEGEVLHDILA